MIAVFIESAICPARAGIDDVGAVTKDGHGIGIRHVQHVLGGKRDGIGAGIGLEVDDLDSGDRSGEFFFLFIPGVYN